MSKTVNNGVNDTATVTTVVFYGFTTLSTVLVGGPNRRIGRKHGRKAGRTYRLDGRVGRETVTLHVCFLVSRSHPYGAQAPSQRTASR